MLHWFNQGYTICHWNFSFAGSKLIEQTLLKFYLENKKDSSKGPKGLGKGPVTSIYKYTRSFQSLSFDQFQFLIL